MIASLEGATVQLNEMKRMNWIWKMGCQMDFNSNGGLVNWTFQQHDERITMRIHEFIAGEELKCKSLRQKVKESAFATQTKRTE